MSGRARRASWRIPVCPGRAPGRVAPESGSAAALVVVALLVLAVPLVSVGLSASMSLRGAVRARDVEVARRLAEVGAAEAYAVVSTGTQVSSQPGHVCEITSPCTPSAADYLGCYTYRSSRYLSVSGCPSPGPQVRDSLGRVWALGVSAGGAAVQVMFLLDSPVTYGRVTAWSVFRR